MTDAKNPTVKCKTSNCTSKTFVGGLAYPFCSFCAGSPTPVPSSRLGAHYTSKTPGLEAIDVIEAFSLGWNLSCALKYILRCTKKGTKDEDLRKAVAYLERERTGQWPR